MKPLLILWLGLFPFFCAGANAEPTSEAAPKQTARQLYRHGRTSLEAGKYSEAIRSFRDLIRGFPSDELVPAARKDMAIAAKARKDAAAVAATPRKSAQNAGSPGNDPRPVLRPLIPEERPAADTEPTEPIKGDPAKCKVHHDRDRHRYCNWYDALAYCEGKLPTVVELQELNMAECPSGKHDGLCGCRYWSSEADGGYLAKTVIFGNGGEINRDKKTFPNIFVLCSGANGIR